MSKTFFLTLTEETFALTCSYFVFLLVVYLVSVLLEYMYSQRLCGSTNEQLSHGL